MNYELRDNRALVAKNYELRVKVMYQIELDGVPMWCVNGMNFLTKEEAEKAEQEIVADYAQGGRYYGD